MDMSLAAVDKFTPWWTLLVLPIGLLVIGVSVCMLLGTLRASLRGFPRARTRSLIAFHVVLALATLIALCLAIGYYFRVEEPRLSEYEGRKSETSIVRIAYERDLWQQGAIGISAVLLTATSLATLSSPKRAV